MSYSLWYRDESRITQIVGVSVPRSVHVTSFVSDYDIYVGLMVVVLRSSCHSSTKFCIYITYLHDPGGEGRTVVVIVVVVIIRE